MPSEIASRNAKGFTLIELMIVVVVIAILASIALPNYRNYIRTQQIRAAQTSLGAMTLAMENVFLQTFAYPATTATTALSQAALPGWTPGENQFTYTISAVNSAARTYTLTATGAGDYSACTLTITNANVTGGPNCFGFTTWR
jgi:type IV pilus assembly protein PilE